MLDQHCWYDQLVRRFFCVLEIQTREIILHRLVLVALAGLVPKFELFGKFCFV